MGYSLNLPNTMPGLHEKLLINTSIDLWNFSVYWRHHGATVVNLVQTMVQHGALNPDKQKKGVDNENSSAELLIKELQFWKNYKMYWIVKSFYSEDDSLIILGIIDSVIGGTLKTYWKFS